MKWIKFTLTALVAVGSVYGFAWYRGSDLPESRQIQVTAQFKCSVETLWALINGLAEQPSWKTQMVSAKMVSTDPEIWEENYGGTTLRMITTERIDKEKLVRTLDDPDLPYQAAWTFEVKAIDDSNTQLTLIENSTIKHPVSRFIAQSILGQTESLQETIAEMQTKLGPASFIPQP